ncbi:MAG: hypothetical protein CSA23_01480 [Deltaproteobacteria bacterium]|nr:MAG: hypothetical protein CSA23_01480 [Deltaproteobacteria bacterium]
MVQKVYISSSNTATFQCPECGMVKTADVRQYANTTKTISVNCNCSCGHTFQCRLEKRKQYRQGADLPGKFTIMGAHGLEDTGLIKVVDLSVTGLKMQMTVPRAFAVGTELMVEFRLDDRKRTFVKKRVTVRNVSGLFVGCSFHPNELDDRALGFYLMH